MNTLESLDAISTTFSTSSINTGVKQSKNAEFSKHWPTRNKITLKVYLSALIEIISWAGLKARYPFFLFSTVDNLKLLQFFATCDY